jgi:hypothetical protein
MRRGVVVWMGVYTRVVRASHGQRQLERPRLVRECQCLGRQQVERRQPRLLSQLLWFSRLSRGSFIFKALLPAIEHSADLLDTGEQSRIVLGRKKFVFPSNLQKEFQNIQPRYRFREDWELLFGGRKARQKNQFECIKKRPLNFLADAEAFHFREVTEKYEPILIGVFELDEG